MHRLWHLLTTFWLMFRLRRAKTEQTQQKAQLALAAQLAQGRGLPMKIGQIMAGMDDQHALKQLTQSVKPWALRDIQVVLEQAWQSNIQHVLQSIEESHAAASLGQVHRATLQSGEVIAIKIQYPDMDKAIQAELKLAGMLPKGGPVKRWAFDLDAYKNALSTNMRQELDYNHEMHMQQRFYQHMNVAGLVVPQVYTHLCHQRVLVQSWEEGVRLSEVAQSWSQFERLSISRTLMQTMFQSLFKHGLVHGDPHPGNLLFSQSDLAPQVHLLDYGCMIEIEKKQRLALLQLILTCRGEIHIDPLEGFAAVGFDAIKLQGIKHKLPALMQIIFRPFSYDKPFNLKEWKPAQETETLLGQQKWLFRAAGPADLFLLMRVFQGLVQQLQTLQSQLPWWPILQQALGADFMLQVKDKKLVKSITIPSHKGTASALHIEVTQNGAPYINLELPAISALDLEDLVPASAMHIIQAQHINIEHIVRQLHQDGLNPCTLIDINDEQKHYHIYLR